MSIKKFWNNIRSGASEIAPTVSVDSPSLNAPYMERVLRGATLWLTYKVVEGFDEKEFDFLSNQERDNLALAVKKFRDVAIQVPGNKPATTEQINASLPQLIEILTILRPDKYADPDAFVRGKKLEVALKDKLPQSVKELRFKTGEDVEGKPALWIWIVYDDDVVKDEDEFAASTYSLKHVIEDTVRELGFEEWPYVRFRTYSELNPPPKKTKK